MKAFLPLARSKPRARLLFVGEGPLRKELEMKAELDGLTQKIIFAGLVLPSQVAKYVGIMDCLAHLSYREAISRALPQALAATKPIIAYDFDGADEVCLDGETGFLVRTGDIAGVTQHLLKLEENPSLRERLATRGRQLVSEEFRLENMLNKIHGLYLELARAAGLMVGAQTAPGAT